MKSLTVVEETVMLAIYRLQENAYSVTIHQQIQMMTGRDIIIGTLFNALRQLCRKGYLIKTKGKPVKGKGKKSIMLYRISGKGYEALDQTRTMHHRIWDDIPEILHRGG
jgi:DNA-binding PadR family transcriptional regulator